MRKLSASSLDVAYTMTVEAEGYTDSSAVGSALSSELDTAFDDSGGR